MDSRNYFQPITSIISITEDWCGEINVN